MERDNEKGATYEVEVTTPDGKHADVRLDDQFEIVGSSEGDFAPTRTYGPKERVVDGVRMKSNTGTLGCFVRTDSFGEGTYFDVGYPVKRIYKRLFIRRKDA